MRGSPECISGNPIRVFNSAWLGPVNATSDKDPSCLVPDKVEHVIGKSGNHEVRACAGTGTKTNFEGLNVADEYNKGDFREKGKIRNVIIEALLGN